MSIRRTKAKTTKSDLNYKMILKAVLILFLIWFFFMFIKWFPSAKIYPKCFEPVSFNTNDLFTVVKENWTTIKYSRFYSSTPEFQAKLMEKGYFGILGTYGDESFEKPITIELDGTIIVRVNSTKEDLFDPGDQVYVSAIVNDEKYIINDFELSPAAFEVFKQSKCYVESGQFRRKRWVEDNN